MFGLTVATKQPQRFYEKNLSLLAVLKIKLFSMWKRMHLSVCIPVWAALSWLYFLSLLLQTYSTYRGVLFLAPKEITILSWHRPRSNISITLYEIQDRIFLKCYMNTPFEYVSTKIGVTVFQWAAERLACHINLFQQNQQAVLQPLKD